MKKRIKSIFIALCIFGIYLSGFAIEAADKNEKPWHLLEQAKIQMEKKEFGLALHLTNRARDIHKEQMEAKYAYMFNALKPKRVRHEGDNISDVYEILHKREDYDACKILDEIFLTHPPIFFDKSISKLMTWLEKRKAFPETDYLAGQIYFSEGDYEQAMHYYKEAWKAHKFLEIPDARFNIIYSLADTSKLLHKYDEQEKYLLLVLTEDPMYGTTNLESDPLQAMIKTITSEKTTEKFFLLYRNRNPIALKAYMDLTEIYSEAGKTRRALATAVLASIITITNLDDIISKDDYNYEYTEFASLLHKLNRKPEVLVWAEKQNFWRSFMNLADCLAKNGNIEQASYLYSKLAESIPSIKYAQEAVYKKEQLNKKIFIRADN
ncbi:MULTISPECIES: lipopolysaccharide assembly protein LapB [unclassified Treponema]|uniref:tetratricopeptide repeat protein n=1 Tax=unclassified Treponema TaxID=2638727 RepID=UPI0020A3647F|nr:MULTISPECIES: hypothetical protein [unclassified Treponema]UTC68417.1 hypothetical protein E4O06_07245 [Treponema sp. OMZ 789]UTC68560.1 hypothetical protein E4O01_07385 [Treponema sp. OMZ 790]UTC71290.1 hypothetical protein E4O02_07575 [Treponema sp. OMZ 791]